MRHRIFVDALTPLVTVKGDEFHHSIRVVRVRAGEEVELFDRAGNAAKGIVESIDRDQAIVRIGDALPSRESKLGIHLAMAIIQLEKFELVLQKATELGVRSIIPMESERVELRRERYASKLERWEKIVFEAVKQCGRTAVPRIEAVATFEEILKRPGPKVLFDADEEPGALPADAEPRALPADAEPRALPADAEPGALPADAEPRALPADAEPGALPADAEPRALLADAEPGALPALDEVTILIGPEGGWSEDELRLARERECIFQRLGPRRLRAETAAIAAVCVVASRFGDL